MARPLRILGKDLWYHVTNRGNARADIFHDDGDCNAWLELLAGSCARYHVELHAYVVMRNHYHLFARTLEANLSAFVHQLQTAYVSHYHYRYDHSGHLFQGRYKAQVVDKTIYGTAVSRYIHLNPVKVEQLREEPPAAQRRYLRSYRASSYRAYLGLVKPHPALVINDTLALFGSNNDARKAYTRFVEEGLLRDMENPFNNTVGQAVLGAETFISRVRHQLAEEQTKDSEGRHSARSVMAISMEDMIATVCQVYHVNWRYLVRRGAHCEARRIAIWLACELCSTEMNGKEIGEVFGGISRSAVAKMRTRFAQELSQSRRLRQRVEAIEKSIFNT